jgi:ATP-dependent DNA helicase DinG
MLEKVQRINEHLEWVQDENICRLMKIQPRTRARLKIAVADLTEQKDTLKLIGTRLTSRNNLAAYEVYVRHWGLVSQDVDVAAPIRNLYKETNGIVFTSATLCQDGNFEPYKKVAGLDVPIYLDEEKSITRAFRFVSIASPFSQQLQEIVIPLDAVKGDYKNKEAWMTSVTKILPELIIGNKGRTLVLFSSYSDLKALVERIGEMITAAGFPLLVQQSGHPTSSLCDEFRAIKESVLFGVDTFWYGVDFKGDTLTQVIITRIPFASPADPLQMAFKRTMPPAIYQNRYQYDTYIKMKQGMGRLIRCETDRGSIVVLDSRYRKFGNKVFASNPTMSPAPP